MKEVIVSRPFLNFHIRQMSKTEFLNCNDALKAVNERRLSQGKPEKRLGHFFENDNFEYTEALCKYLNENRNPEILPIKKKRFDHKEKRQIWRHLAASPSFH